MGIQIKGSNDTISAADGSMVLEGSALVFDNENITGISTMGTGHITGTATIDDDLKVGVSTFFVDKSAGRIGIGTVSPNKILTVRGSSTPEILLKPIDATPAIFVGDTIRTGSGQHLAEYRGNWDGTTVARMVIVAGSDTGNKDDGEITFNTAASGSTVERLRIKSSGKILGGNHINDRGAVLQIESSDHNMIGIHRNTADHGAPAMTLSASRGTSAGSATVVQSGDYLGLIRFSGADGSDLASGAQITGIVDGTPGAGDMPTRLAFWTSPDGSESPVERVRIDQHGKVGISSGTIDPAGNALLIRAASTFQTRYGHIMLTGDGATVGEGPQIVFSESGSGSNNAGAYIGHVRTGSNSIGDLVFGTREVSGNADTVPVERLRITAAGKLIIGDYYQANAWIDLDSDQHYVVTNGGKAANGIHLRGQGGNSGEFGGGISFGCNGTAAAAIAAEQMSADTDVVGLSFFTHATSDGSDDAIKRMNIASNGGIQCWNWPSNGGFIFRSDSATLPTEANVQSSNGRGMTSGKNTSIAQNTTTTLGNTHWGGLAWVGYSGTGHQGYRLVAYGYGGAGVSVLFSGQWVGSLTTTFSMSLYNLQVSHNASNALAFWLINIGV